MKTYSYNELLEFFFSVKQTFEENSETTDSVYIEIKEALKKLNNKESV